MITNTSASTIIDDIARELGKVPGEYLAELHNKLCQTGVCYNKDTSSFERNATSTEVAAMQEWMAEEIFANYVFSDSFSIRHAHSHRSTWRRESLFGLDNLKKEVRITLGGDAICHDISFNVKFQAGTTTLDKFYAYSIQKGCDIGHLPAIDWDARLEGLLKTFTTLGNEAQMQRKKAAMLRDLADRFSSRASKPAIKP